MGAVPESAHEGGLEVEKLDWRRIGRVMPLALALIAAVAVYAPAVTSALANDDYIYLVAGRQLSFTHYLRASFVPGSNDSVLLFTKDFWRPLYFFSYWPMERIFGGNVVPYHLTVLGIHLAGVVLLWLLALKLTGRWLVAAVAAAIFAVHPVAIDSVTWISSINSVALPLGLASWLCFANAIESPAPARRWWLVGFSMLLFALAVLFRETGVVFLAAMVIWYILVPSRTQLLKPRTYLVLIPFVVLGVAYLLIRTRLFTIPAANPYATSVDSHVVRFSVDYWKFALVPFISANGGWRESLQLAGVAIILATVPLALFARRWLLLALVLGFLASAVPYATSTFGVAPRYFYFPCALFALAAGVAVAEIRDLSIRYVGRWHTVPTGVIVGATIFGLAAAGYVANARVHTWIQQNPDVNTAWANQLRATFPTLPNGGTVYVANGPLLLQLFGGYTEAGIVEWYYPQVAHVVPIDLTKGQPRLGPNDRIFIYHPGG